MENYGYTSYPESGDSSPRSREIEFDNPPPWEEQPPHNYKVKFMCSYGGKIHPRPHDNQLSYVGGETKILAVDRNIKFSGFMSKLYALYDADVCFKYQLPGEDLDALISVTNDDDLEHMMHEYDRLYRASARPARLRLFLFPVNPSAPGSFGSSEGKSDRERFVEALNSAPVQSVDASSPPASAVNNNVDFLFGLDKGVPPNQPAASKPQDQISESSVPEPEIQVGASSGSDNRFFGSDPTANQVDIQRQIQDLQRLQIAGQEQAMYQRKSDENLVGGGFGGDYYVQKMPEKVPPAQLPVTMTSTMSAPGSYWAESHIAGGGFPATMSAAPGPEQQMYMIHAPASVYHAQMGRQMTGQAGQGYYAMQRMPPDVYREQPVYNMVPQQPGQPTLPPQPPSKVAAYSEGIGMVRGTTGGMGLSDTGYTQVAYDSAGRQVYYTAPGGVVPTYQGMAAVSADMRPGGALNPEGKVVTKVSQTSV